VRVRIHFDASECDSRSDWRGLAIACVGMLVLTACRGSQVGIADEAGGGAEAGASSGAASPGGAGNSQGGSAAGTAGQAGAELGGAPPSTGGATQQGGAALGGTPPSTGGAPALGGTGGSAVGGNGGQGQRGPVLVDLGTIGFSIDSTEVTRGQYSAFLASKPSVLTQARRCSEWNGDFMPVFAWPPASSELDLPVVGVDWCDAYAFCLWAGKRLCGRIGGGAAAYDEYADPTKSQWYSACSLGGLRNYPYGSVYSGQACNGYDLRKGTPTPVGSLSGCTSNEFPVFDLSGNVDEWEDACSDSADPSLPANPAQVDCRLRGGDYAENDKLYLQCQSAGRVATWRNGASSMIGFRCCS
jgi:formylglycine-generating enzyme